MRLCRPHLRPHPRGFTLLELMISIAIVLILMLGINYVFSASSRTVSVGMALSNLGRDLRGARRVLDDDFKNMVPADEMPALVIHNESVFAWRDRLDKLTDVDADPATFDADDDETNGEEVVMSAAAYNTTFNFRHHRQDRISFFVRNPNGEYGRQTGDNTTYVGTETSPEAWISYGLLRQPGKHPSDATKDNYTYWRPGARGTGTPLPDESKNQNNFFASQWILGRNVVLLKDGASLPSTTAGYAAYPLAMNTPAVNVTRETPPYPNAAAWRIQESRVDLAGWTIERLREEFAGTLAAEEWWRDVDSSADAVEHDQVIASSNPATDPTINYLFWANPYINKTNFGGSIANQTREAALITPIFLRGCTQFTVEFAGDFFDQGTVAAPEPVGTIDYDTIGAAGNSQIRWYGMDRDMNGDGTPNIGDVTSVSNHVPTELAAGHPSRFTTGTVADFEHLPATPGAATIWAWGPTTGDPPRLNTPGDASWVRPSLIRITIELIDANGRLPDGQRMEFIFALKK